MAQLKELTMETEMTLKEVMDLIFERAMLRPNSSALYAKMCCCLSNVQVPTTADPTAAVSFQTFLIRRCQAEFEENHGRNDIFQRRQRLLETAKDEEELERLKKVLDNAKASRRSVNTIKFIGELFRSNILSAAVMHGCITTLLQNRDEESLECLCELLRIVGKDLEVVTAKRVMDLYFARMDEIQKDGKNSSTVSFMLKNTVDLRQRNWLPETALTSENNESTESQSSTVQTAGPTTSSGETGCRVPQTRNVASGSAAWPELTVAKKSQLNIHKIEKRSGQLQPEEKESGPTGSPPAKPLPTKNDNNRRMRKVAKKGELKRKAPSEEAEEAQQVKPKDVISCVKTIVNRLTPENFQDLMAQLKELTMETEMTLKEVMDLIFERAMLRPNSSALYAKMCCCLSNVQVPTTADPTAAVSFQTFLIRRCQAEFEENHGRNDIFQRRQRLLETAKDEEELERLKKVLDNAKASRRSVNTIKFIGELFRSNILSAAVMHGCITTLLQNRDEESLECLCELLGIVGKDLEVVTAKRVMDLYFARMDGIQKDGKNSSTVSFMLKNTVDLRQRNWLPETDLTSENNESTESQSSAVPAGPITSSGETGCRVPQTRNVASGSAAWPELTVAEKSELNMDKSEKRSGQLQPEEKRAAPLALPLLNPCPPSMTTTGG
ncbi:uncharacterized protein LOC120787331 [Xiphias gladius]|uniref:uncharacterized protein LOC120787331 n=1 Tax=Xiphias gladius TaxID=8245 RepID=UPI001A98DE5E|nr:uncharacterized protein LOC120787331 [Xiphias gladius]